MSEPCIVFSEPIEVSDRLSELGLSSRILADVVKHYAMTVISMTPDHPSWCTGIAPAGEAVFALRQLTRPLGWTREEVRGFALTIHPKGLLGVNVAKGDLNTGNPLCTPTSHSEKGICTEEAVANNQTSFDFGPETKVVADEQSGRPTWWLLVRVTEKQVPYEFSLPVSLSDDKHINKWAERLTFQPIPISELSNNEEDDDESTPEIVPEITRKNG